MNKEEIEEQLKLSKRQNKDKRYDYLDSEFNAINYCIKLEKYTNKVLQENKKLKKENKILRENAENNDKVVDNANWENLKLKEHIEKYEHYCKTTGIEELMQQNQKYKEVVDKAIKLIEDSYYSKNTTDIDSIVLSGDKLLQVRKILKEVE